MRSNALTVIRTYLLVHFTLSEAQLVGELARFERHTDLAEELAVVLEAGHFPSSEAAISVSVEGGALTAEQLCERRLVTTPYAAYSLLAQLRDHPEIIEDIKRGLHTK